MKKSNISQNDAETIMIALDQISQTIDVMHGVVNRLKLYMDSQMGNQMDILEQESGNTEKAASASSSAIAEAMKNGPVH